MSKTKTIKALHTLSDGEKIYISKDKYYDMYDLGYKIVVIDNYGNELELSNDDIQFKFEIQ